MKRAATKSEAPQAISTRTKWLHARAGEVGGLLAASRCTGRCWGRVCVLPQSAERTKSSVEKASEVPRTLRANTFGIHAIRIAALAANCRDEQ